MSAGIVLWNNKLERKFLSILGKFDAIGDLQVKDQNPKEGSSWCMLILLCDKIRHVVWERGRA